MMTLCKNTSPKKRSIAESWRECVFFCATSPLKSASPRLFFCLEFQVSTLLVGLILPSFFRVHCRDDAASSYER